MTGNSCQTLAGGGKSLFSGVWAAAVDFAFSEIWSGVP